MNGLIRYSYYLLFLLLPGQLLLAQCDTPDCVWPGDGNNDGISNNIDLLYVGLTYDENFMGIPRPNASTIWIGQEADDWPLNLPSGLNYKYSDFNGDGYINELDALLILTNYDSTNQFFVPPVDPPVLGEDLFLMVDNPAYNPGDTVHVEVHLGSPNNQLEGVYGIAFTIQFDTTNIHDLINIKPHGGWLNGTDTTLAVEKWIPGASDHIDFGITRFNQTSVDGFGEIASFDIVITDDIIGVQGDEIADTRSTDVQLTWQFENILGLNSNEEDLQISVIQDSILLTTDSIFTNAVYEEVASANAPAFLVFPNPATDYLTIQFEEHQLPDDLKLYDSTGLLKHRWQISNQSTSIQLADLATGFYYLMAKFPTITVQRKIVVHRE